NEIGAIFAGEQSFTTKKAETELLVNDGDTVVIGGIRKSREDKDQSGVPGLMNMFVLLMFVGASPGSTGGGVKTSTMGLMLVAGSPAAGGRL
ncbi:MAG: hypothetical protein R6V02_10060, partial [Candidatus Aminicenantes bacterium]